MEEPEAGVTIVGTTPPSFAELGSPIGIAGLTGFFAPLGAPDGARDLERTTYARVDGADLDVWVHRRVDPSDPRPCVVFVHGGGWSSGTPAAHLRHAHLLAARGFVTALVTYRLAPAAPWPAAVEDVQLALVWLADHADELGLDPGRIAVAGASAGAHLAAMAALGAGAVPSVAVRAAVLWSPPLDLRVVAAIPEARFMVDAFLPGSTPDTLLRASPIAHVRAGAPPMLTLAGDCDPIAPVPVLRGFHEALHHHGVRSELVVFEGRPHGFDLHPVDWDACFERMAAFLDETLG